MIDCYNELAPNFKASILHRDTSSARMRWSRNTAWSAANIFHGELSPGAAVPHAPRRPATADYRTPLPGLYYGSSATHAGGRGCAASPAGRRPGAAITDQKSAKRVAQVRKLTRPLLIRFFFRNEAHERRRGPPRRCLVFRATGVADRPALTAMLEARTVGPGRGQPAAGQPGRADGQRGSPRGPSGPEVYLVNPAARNASPGAPCHASLADLPGPVDLVLLAVPDAAVEEQLALAARRGDRSAVLFGSAHELPGQPPGQAQPPGPGTADTARPGWPPTARAGGHGGPAARAAWGS